MRKASPLQRACASAGQRGRQQYSMTMIPHCVCACRVCVCVCVRVCVQRVLKVLTAARPPFLFSVVRWQNEHGSHNDLSSHFLQRLCTESPCSAAFRLIEQAPGFICTHFIDVTEPGGVCVYALYVCTHTYTHHSQSKHGPRCKTPAGFQASCMGVQCCWTKSANNITHIAWSTLCTIRDDA